MSRLLVVAALTLTTSCASIVSSSTYPVMIDTVPSGESVTVTNKSGLAVYQGSTPMMLVLDASAGFFQSERYTVTAQSGATTTLSAQVDPWWFGNLLIAPILGGLIIDPATGAMWKLPTRVSVPLVPVVAPEPETPVRRSLGRPES